MRKKIVISIIIAGCVGFVSLTLSGCEKNVVSKKSFTVTKAWWPAWDLFQLGLKRYEQDKKSIQTTFLQTDDYGPALNAFKGNRQSFEQF